MSDDVIRTVRLGAEGPEVGVQGLGCMGMSEFYGDTDPGEAHATLEHALERGVTLFDTADMYGAGANEEFLSPFVNAHRDDLVIATKFGNVRGPGGERLGIRGDRPYVHRAADASLRRLSVDVIDLYYMHRLDPTVPIEETVGAMAELVAAGKVRHLGLSEVTGPELRRAAAVHPIAALQSEWSLFSRDVEHSAVPAAVELGTAFVPYSPLGRGFLTGTVTSTEGLRADDFRRSAPRFSDENARANAALLDPVRRVAEANEATMAQVALAWVHSRAERYGMTVVPIPGTRRRSRLDENLGAVRLRLSDEDLSVLEPIADLVAGDRYADLTSTSAGRE